jgi:hypothetical protein
MINIPSSQFGGEVACIVVFFLEVLINLVTIPQVVLTPAKFLALFVPKSKNDKSLAEDLIPVVKGFVPWYGVLLAGLTYAELRALIQYNISALAVIQEALLFGDLLHLAAAAHLSRLVGGLSFGNGAGVVITLFLIPWRIYYL